MTKIKLLFAVLVAALVAALVAPVGAADSSDPRAQRDAVRQRKAQIAAELDVLKASERELLDAAAALDDQVLAQAARVDAARQAVQVAEAELAEATRALGETSGLIAELAQLFKDRAVAEFISPRSQRIDDVIESSDLAETARKHALLDSVASNDEDLLDELDAAREDYALARAAAAEAEAHARARRTQTEEQLAKLEADRARQRTMQQAVSARQKEVLAEVDALAAADSTLTRIIREREAAAGSSGSLPVGKGGCMWPARGRVTSEYGRRWGRLHAGIDIAAPTGSPIYAARAGTVFYAGRQSGYGNVVMIDHGGGFTTVYGHMSRIMTSDGASVDRGSRIGNIGNTGRSTGPHVHFETRYGGSPRNPRGCLG